MTQHGFGPRAAANAPNSATQSQTGVNLVMSTKRERLSEEGEEGARAKRVKLEHDEGNVEMPAAPASLEQAYWLYRDRPPTPPPEVPENRRQEILFASIGLPV
jgi:hypothetical protein